MRPLVVFIRCAAAVLAAVSLTGCVSSKYKLAKGNTLPALPLNLVTNEPPVEAVVNTVIAYQGPGSWKREALWDEYIVTVKNHGSAPLVIDSISLSGLSGQPARPATEPWTVEKETRAKAAANYGVAKEIAVQVGGGFATMTATALAGSGVMALVYGGGGTAVGAAALGAIGLPVFVGGSVYANIRGRHQVEREFQRRRLGLPFTLAAGENAQGSLFFPITPGPRQLVLHARQDEQARNVVVDLASLAGLHLRGSDSGTASANSRH